MYSAYKYNHKPLIITRLIRYYVCTLNMSSFNSLNYCRSIWDMAVTRIDQLASEMRLSTTGQSVGGSKGNVGKDVGKGRYQ